MTIIITIIIIIIILYQIESFVRNNLKTVIPIVQSKKSMVINIIQKFVLKINSNNNNIPIIIIIITTDFPQSKQRE